MPITLDHVKAVTAKALAEGAYRRLEGRERVAVHIRDIPLKAGSVLRIGYNRYEVEADAYLVFIDLMHGANYEHPVLYELHNLKDGSVRTISESYPIADPEMERSLIAHILPGREGK
jgi:hypothetical protein